MNFVVLLLFSCLSLLGCGGLDQAERLWEDGKLDEAIALCEREVAGGASDPKIYYFLSFLYNQKIGIMRGDGSFSNAQPEIFVKAVNAGRHYISEKPSEAEGYLNLGVSYFCSAEYLYKAKEPNVEILRAIPPLGSSRFNEIAQDPHAAAEYLLYEAQTNFLIAAGWQETRESALLLHPDPATKKLALVNLQRLQGMQK